MTWSQTGDAWFGKVTKADNQAVVVHSPKWGLYDSGGLRLPPEGTEVEIRVIRRSPYWALVDES